METKVCKKCGRTLPEKYKYKKCESCRNQSVKKIQETGKTVLGVATIIGGTVVAIATKGKISPGNKS